MFDFAWTEIALIGVVALVAIGPKDLPVAIKAVANMVKKARKMAGEFQTHVDEMVKDTDLKEVREQIGQLRRLDIKGVIERAVDSDGSIRRTMNENPMATPYVAPSTDPSSPVLSDPAAVPQDLPRYGPDTLAHVPPATMAPQDDGMPAFVPPAVARPPVPPAFVPPSAAASRAA